jgi:hypothetical protein
MEFLITVGYPLTFYKFHDELFGNGKKRYNLKLQNIYWRLVIYFSLMSILIVSRYCYYVTEETAKAMDSLPNQEINCEELIPSYVSELLFCYLVFYQIYTANII